MIDFIRYFNDMVKNLDDNKCRNCSSHYKDAIVFIADDEIWKNIDPEIRRDIEKGKLCPTCILNKLSDLGINPESVSIKLKKEQ